MERFLKLKPKCPKLYEDKKNYRFKSTARSNCVYLHSYMHTSMYAHTDITQPRRNYTKKENRSRTAYRRLSSHTEQQAAGVTPDFQ